ncbi:nuclear transport factor 2 family protein [Parahaliea maris]|uniref:Nuclear transport factor 2 family protein n=1 Tax=Parahaliea maris TaxID=2716870 RepID=A0A5C9A275_9GAMM|nr:nuclear transport factor 2 family protein [Parahaliea maris]TXS94052.1 nuclear transport factor 2 family protein [Parahaliea maris]
MGEQRQVLNKKNMNMTGGLPLEAGDGGLEDLRRSVQQLMDIEAIKQLKHAYFRCIDTANLEELATLFHDDVLVHFIGGHYEWKVEGKQNYLDNIQHAFTNVSVGHHNGHQPEIEIHSATEARGIWYLADHMWILPHKSHTTGTALYWDSYEKVDGKWLIRETRYERLYEINTQLAENPRLSSHYLGVHGPAPAEG